MSPFSLKRIFKRKKSRGDAPSLAGTQLNYQSLCGDNAIRLLQLDVDADEIVCKVIHSSLEQEYVALSYTWRDPNPVVSRRNGSVWETHPTISCNGQEIRIQRNLFDALQMLKSSRESRYIWIDALCINQQDENEQRSQVAIMGYIYARATEVIVWLGVEDGTTASAASIVGRASPLIQRWQATENLDPDSITGSELGSTAQDLFSTDNALVFYQLLSRTWFRRGWVVQEVALARRCRLFCGGHEFDLTAIWFCALLMFKTLFMQERYTEQDSQEEYAEGLMGIGAFCITYSVRLEVERGGYRAMEVQTRLRKRYGSIQDQQLPFAYLEDLLCRSQVFQFERAEDRVLAPMALIRTLYSPQHSFADCFEAAYETSSIRHVYTGITRLVTEKTVSLSILSLAGSKSSDSSLPTWVPDFGLRQTSLYQEGFNASQGWSVYSDRKYGHAEGIRDSRERTLGPSNSLDPLLAVTAIFFDNIENETKSAPCRRPSFSESSEWFHLLDELPSTNLWSGEPCVVALGKTLLAGHTNSDSTETAILDNLPPEWFEESIGEEFKSTYALYSEGDQQKPEHSESLEDSYHTVLPISEEQFFRRNTEFSALRMTFSLAREMNEAGPFREFSSEMLKLVEKEMRSRLYFKNMFMERYFRIAVGRRLALTRQKALCLVPGTTCAGDCVAFLKGSNMPFILRRGSTAGRFVLVGEVYVHGLMTGKAMELGLEQKPVLLE